jgi:hypothetical protein
MLTVMPRFAAMTVSIRAGEVFWAVALHPAARPERMK